MTAPPAAPGVIRHRVEVQDLAVEGDLELSAAGRQLSDGRHHRPPWTLIISSRSATLYMFESAMTHVPGSTFML